MTMLLLIRPQNPGCLGEGGCRAKGITLPHLPRTFFPRDPSLCEAGIEIYATILLQLIPWYNLCTTVMFCPSTQGRVNINIKSHTPTTFFLSIWMNEEQSLRRKKRKLIGVEWSTSSIAKIMQECIFTCRRALAWLSMASQAIFFKADASAILIYMAFVYAQRSY